MKRSEELAAWYDWSQLRLHAPQQSGHFVSCWTVLQKDNSAVSYVIGKAHYSVVWPWGSSWYLHFVSRFKCIAVAVADSLIACQLLLCHPALLTSDILWSWRNFWCSITIAVFPVAGRHHNKSAHLTKGTKSGVQNFDETSGHLASAEECWTHLSKYPSFH